MQEEGFPQAQRVLLNDVSGKAVYTLLQFLYTAVCHLTHILLPDVLQLARRSVNIICFIVVCVTLDGEIMSSIRNMSDPV